MSEKTYLGEATVEQQDVPQFKDFTKTDWALYFIGSYGQIDGEHHKLWVLDQVARILNGSAIEIKLAKWTSGSFEYRVNVLEPSNEYLEWVEAMKDGEDGPDSYTYDEGRAP